MRRFARIDRKQKELVEGLRKAGYLVQILAAVGGGVPDLLVGCPWGVLVLLEVKNDRDKAHWSLTPAQEKWLAQWQDMPIFIVEDLRGALFALESWRSAG